MDFLFCIIDPDAVLLYCYFSFMVSCLLLLLLLLLGVLLSANADGFSLESEWQQVSPNLRDSSQYSGRSQ